MKKKNLLQFKTEIKKNIGWNAPIGFWYKFVYEQYARDIIDYEAALKKMEAMKLYTGI